MLKIRPLNDFDSRGILNLHRDVAAVPGSGLARASQEIGDGWAEALLEKANQGGLILGSFDGDNLVGEIHALRIGPQQFSHVLTDLTVAVSPNHQGKGIGASLFEALFDHALQLVPPVTRVELVARSGNSGAIALYKRLGFVEEGCFKGRVRLPDGTIEDDIPMAKMLKHRAES